ncbi:MAG: hypothetical protein Q4D27_05895, partial [Coriobacteriia bacterium]|nr:hypothetical protein [Coriobacteriia bacterium]
MACLSYAVTSIVAVVIAFAGVLALSSPAFAASYELEIENQTMDTGTNVFHGVPGEKLSLIPNVYSLKTYEDVEGVTYKWKCSAKLKATVLDDRVTFTKLPGVSTYKVYVEAYRSKGKLLCSNLYKLQVKNKPAITAKVTKNGSSKNLASVKRNQAVFLVLNGAKYGWDNNKVFCKWSVKHVK